MYGRRSGTWPLGSPEAIEDARDGVRLSDESDHAHSAGASGADQRIDFVDTAEQICPSLARGRGVRRRCCSGISGLGVVLGRLAAPSFSPGNARIEAMVADQVFSWRRDLCQDAGHILHGVDALGRRGSGVVATALGEVQHLLRARQQLQASQAHGWPHHVPDEGLDRLVIAGG